MLVKFLECLPPCFSIWIKEIYCKVFNEDIINSDYSNQYITKFDKIITQNEKTLTVYSPFLQNNQANICISELPDYRKSLNKIITNSL